MDRLQGKHLLPFSWKKLPSRVVLSYIFDYLIIIFLIGLFTAIDKVEPFKQHFALQNYTLQYPYAVNERIPVFDLVIIACLAPAIIIATYTLVIDGLFSHSKGEVPVGGRRKWIRRYPLKARLWELNCGILGLALAVAASFTVTGTLKNAIGKPRPDLIDRCQPKAGSHDPPVFGLSDSSICTQTDDAILNDGFKSFPSGHSSTAFAGLTYLSIYLAGKLHVMDSKGEVWKTFIVLVPSLAAALVAGTRIMDARHHPFDVISGSLLGILLAWGSYRQYFPPVTEPWRKGRAYPIRSWGQEALAPRGEGMVRVDDAEELLHDVWNGQDNAEEQGRKKTRAPASQAENKLRKKSSSSRRQRRRERSLRTRQRGYEDAWSPSFSEDESADDVELQPISHFRTPKEYSPNSAEFQYVEATCAHVEAPPLVASAYLGPYDPVQASFPEDTSYHSVAVPTSGHRSTYDSQISPKQSLA